MHDPLLSNLQVRSLMFQAAVRYRFPAGRPRTPGAPVSEPYEGSVLSMGSDAPPSAWILANNQLDYSLVNRMVLAAMSALAGAGRAAAAVGIGCRWAALSDGVFDESIMPACIAAAPRAGNDVQPFAAALSKVRSLGYHCLLMIFLVRHTRGSSIFLEHGDTRRINIHPV